MQGRAIAARGYDLSDGVVETIEGLPLILYLCTTVSGIEQLIVSRIVQGQGGQWDFVGNSPEASPSVPLPNNL